MRKLIGLVAIMAFATGIVLVSGSAVIAAPKDKKAEEKPAVVAPVSSAQMPAGKVVCKFKDKEQMGEFEQLYIAKQATFGRMSVLQAYFSLEQNNLQEIDKQMESKFKFKMDPSKMYDLNRDAMEIKEVGDVPQQPAPAPAAQQ
ncbi:MAG: hypothetical protein NTX47_00180 [Candidatus Omnitrophica bacterium]|nr:hypothetical protein [Candidatus Omnitrophota bacterium]